MRSDGRAQSIVVVEDDDHIADLLDLYLTQAGFRVFRACAPARRGWTSSPPGSPTSSCSTSGCPAPVDGLDVCRRLRAVPAAPERRVCPC